MKDKNTLQSYVNNFRRHFAQYLKPNVGLSSNIYSVESEGAIIEFKMDVDLPNEDHFMPIESSINDALGKIRQGAFGGNLGGFIFKGTNVIAEHNRIILIKGDNDEWTWNDRAAQSDIMRVINKASRGRP